VLGGFTPGPGLETREATGPIPLGGTTGRRRALADWIASPGNPLTARVMVNRIWQYHFGRGIVATPSDYGTRGARPSHPELLDWLAAEFAASGWSIKHIHRLIVNSAAFRQSAVGTEEARAADPENAFLSHFSRRRLDADEVRDSVLAATGALNLKAGGRPIVPPQSREELFIKLSLPRGLVWLFILGGLNGFFALPPYRHLQPWIAPVNVAAAAGFAVYLAKSFLAMVREADELERRIHLESIAVAFVAAAGACIVLGAVSLHYVWTMNLIWFYAIELLRGVLVGIKSRQFNGD